MKRAGIKHDEATAGKNAKTNGRGAAQESPRTVLREWHVAERYPLSRAVLRKWRRQRKGPSFIQVDRMVFYRVEDIEKFLEEHAIGT